MTVESHIRRASASAQRWLAVGDEAGVIPGEESVTDLILLSLASIPGNVCRVHRVPKNDEGKVGPDFVLWLVSSRNGVLVGLPLLVQAKRLYPNGRFAALHAVSPTHPQMGVVRGVAEKWGLLPVYAFYQPPGASVAGVPGVLPSKCALVNETCAHAGASQIHPALHPAFACQVRDEADLGVALARADEVAALIGGDAPSIGQLGPLSVPFTCLARCACLEQTATGEDGGDPDQPSAHPGDGDALGFDDLVAVAMSRLMSPDELHSSGPREVPGWIASTLRDRDGTAIEQRNITPAGLSGEVGLVVVLTDADPDQLV